MTERIRAAQPADLSVMVELAEQAREKLQQYQPVFWRKADDSYEKHYAYLRDVLARESTIAFVYEQEEDGTDFVVAGFVIASIVKAPPVYAAGLTCHVDDFCVAHEANWLRIGRLLLDEVKQRAKERGANQIVVVCPHLDHAKRSMLQDAGLTIASEWYVTSL
uniref:N-acetyltransferase n=1 Tax=Thermosporothrix sp. COM3 TaxID=2490863 RepID=A0A455SII8_9CHLR|nr:N-acetyltransferase [Thermosporothrix sp. COM3]